jgi:outer membrane protein assembly factor BamD
VKDTVSSIPIIKTLCNLRDKMNFMNFLNKNLLYIALVTLGGCGGNAEPRENKQLGAGDKILYEEALADIGENNKAAVDKLNVLELNYPKSSKLPEAMSLKMYALYKAGDYMGAAHQADKFVALYPQHRNAAYAYYVKGLCSQIQSMDSQRDQEMTEEALIAFDQLEKQFPNSSYVKGAKAMSSDSRNVLAVKEIEIGRSYAAKGQYGAAAERYQCVIDKYPNSAAAPEAMYRMVEVHSNLNSIDNAHRYCNMLKSRYPNSHWTDKAIRITVTRYKDSGTKYPTKYLEIPSEDTGFYNN